MLAVNDLALESSIRLNKQLEELLQMMKVFSYKKNIVDNQQVVDTITAIEESLVQAKLSQAVSDHCRRLLTSTFSLIQMSTDSVDHVTFLDKSSSSNVVPIRPTSIDLVDISFDRILKASDALNPDYVGNHVDESLMTYLYDLKLTETNNNNQQPKRRHLSLVSTNNLHFKTSIKSNNKPNSNHKKGK
mgnify:FL=1|tara:strand:- start:1911 stop:2474 length:564 start_codon:yes stop_codon:yes gene_type:complete